MEAKEYGKMADSKHWPDIEDTVGLILKQIEEAAKDGEYSLDVYLEMDQRQPILRWFSNNGFNWMAGDDMEAKDNTEHYVISW